MLLGAILLPVFFALTFAVPAALGPVAGRASGCSSRSCSRATAFSLFQVPYIALPAELVQDYDARTRLLSARVVVLTFAILLFGAGGPALRDAFRDDERLGYLVMAIVAGCVLGAGMLVAVVQRAARRARCGRRSARVDRGELPARARRRCGAASRSARCCARSCCRALATGMMLAGAQYVATWVLGSGVTLLFVALDRAGPAVRAAVGDHARDASARSAASRSPRSSSGSRRSSLVGC